MMLNNEAHNLDDTIKMMDSLLSRTEKDISELRLDKRAAEIKAGSSAPEDLFKANLVCSYIDQIKRMSLNISSLRKPDSARPVR